MLKKAKDIQERVQELQLGWGTGTGGNRGLVSNLALKHRARTSLGIREAGAGLKYHFNIQLEEVKQWHAAERRMGHVVDRADILQEFVDRLEHHLYLLKRSPNILEEMPTDQQAHYYDFYC